MILARVTGNAVSSAKIDVYRARTLLRVQPLDLDGTDRGSSFLAFDSVGAGLGDVVLVVAEGGSANIVAGTRRQPFDTVVVAVVDDVQLDADPPQLRGST